MICDMVFKLRSLRTDSLSFYSCSLQIHTIPKELFFTSDEEIAKWREERRKKYPTNERVRLKLLEVDEKLERGETAKDDVYRYMLHSQKSSVMIFNIRTPVTFSQVLVCLTFFFYVGIWQDSHMTLVCVMCMLLSNLPYKTAIM